MRNLLIPLIAVGVCFCMSLTGIADETLMHLGVDAPSAVQGESKYIRLKAERLRFYFSWTETRVEAEFDLENLGKSTESAVVGFPDDALMRAYVKTLTEEEAYQKGITWEYEHYLYLDTAGVKPYRGFTTWVGTPDNAMDTMVYKFEKRDEALRLKSDALSADAEWSGVWTKGEVALWHCTKLKWQPHETITIGHTYTADNGVHGLGISQPFYDYLLATGANWAGTIGRAEVDLYLEGGMRVEDLALGDPPCAGYDDANPQLDSWEVVSPTHLQLVWEDFEPIEDKAYIGILAYTEMELIYRQRVIDGIPTWEEAVEAGIVEPRF
jgi:hypothetical protein